MPSFEQGDIVRVPFAYLDSERRQHRPALVISSRPLAGARPLVWLAMITSAANTSWPGDQPIADLAETGLPIASVVRPCKVATLQASDAQRIGRLDWETLERVLTFIRDHL